MKILYCVLKCRLANLQTQRPTTVTSRMTSISWHIAWYFLLSKGNNPKQPLSHRHCLSLLLILLLPTHYNCGVTDSSMVLPAPVTYSIFSAGVGLSDVFFSHTEKNKIHTQPYPIDTNSIENKIMLKTRNKITEEKFFQEDLFPGFLFC